MLTSLDLNKVNSESINLTGVRLIVLFSLLLDSPKTAEDINQHFIKNNYPKNIFSLDTLRNDLNALRLAGCTISRADKSTDYKYILSEHPFSLNINENISNLLTDVYNKIYKHLSISELIHFENFFKTLAKYAQNEEIAEKLIGISAIKHLDKTLLKDIYNAIIQNRTISFQYKSPNSRLINIQFIPQKLGFRSKKLYVFGFSITHNDCSFFHVSKIQTPLFIHLEKTKFKKTKIKVQYKLNAEKFKNFEANENQKILNKTLSEIFIEEIVDNKFILTQNLLAYGKDCTIIAPENYKKEFIQKLKSIRKLYKNG